MNHITFVSSNYPSKYRPFCGTFVQQLVRAIARMGIKCSVISPVSIFHRRYGKFDPEVLTDATVKENPITVLRPRYISFSSRNLIIYNTAHLTQLSYERAVYKALINLNESPNILYGHFLYQSGAAVVHIAERLGIPSCVAVGEGTFWSVEPLGYDKAIRDFSNVSALISVSSFIKSSLMQRLKIPEEKIQVIPNGVDLSMFYPRGRSQMRKKYGLPKDKFIVAFTGHFDEGKGPHRILSAVNGNDNIGLIFIGNGNIALRGKNILFNGVLEHSKVPEMLSAADIFVLPTLVEGSCNSILEALACGLPIITSKGEFNDDIVDNDVAIRVDPLNINEIRDAIFKLFHDKDLVSQMSIKSLEKIKQFDINLRAKKIMELINVIKHGDISEYDNKRKNIQYDKHLHA